MKNWKRNAVVAAIALFVCAAVYLNWSYEQEAEAGKTLGESTLVGSEDPLLGGGAGFQQSREADADAGEDRSGTDGRGTGLYGVRRIQDLFVGNCLTDLTKV